MCSKKNFLLDYRRNVQWILKMKFAGIRSCPIVRFTSCYLQSGKQPNATFRIASQRENSSKISPFGVSLFFVKEKARR